MYFNDLRILVYTCPFSLIYYFFVYRRVHQIITSSHGPPRPKLSTGFTHVIHSAPR